MKNQRSTTEHRRFGLRTVAVCVLMLVALVCCFTVSSFADGIPAVTKANLTYANVSGVYTATYDGDTDVTDKVTLNADVQTAMPDGVTLKIASATLDSALPGDRTVTVTFELEGENAGEYTAPEAVEIEAKILYEITEIVWPELEFVAGDKTMQNIKVSARTSNGALLTGISASVENLNLTTPGTYSVKANIDTASCVLATGVTVANEITVVEGVPPVAPALGDLISAANRFENGYYVMTYGTANVAADLDLAAGFHTPANVDVTVDKVVFDSNDVGTTSMTVYFKLTGADAHMYQAPQPVPVPVKITPKMLAWTTPTQITVNLPYVYNQTVYETTVDLTPLGGIAGTYPITVPASVNVKVDSIAKPGAYEVDVAVDLGNVNYAVADASVKVVIDPIVIDTIGWGQDTTFRDYVFTYGDSTAKDVTVSVSGTNLPSAMKTLKVNYYQNGNKIEFAGKAGTYEIRIENPDPERIVFADGLSLSHSLTVNPRRYEISMNDVTYLGDKDETTGENTTKFFLPVAGDDIPQDVLDLITYWANGERFYGTSEYGKTTVTAKLPVSPDYYFTNNGKKITSNQLSADIYVSRKYIATGSEEGKFDVIVYGTNGFAAEMEAVVTKPEFDRSVLSGYPIHSEFTLTLKGDFDKTQSFILFIPLTDELNMRHLDALTVDHLYIYEPATNELVKATENERYTVTLEDGYYKIEGYTATQPITFVIAPEYNTPFWISAPGIALIVMIVLAIIMLLFFVGLKLRKSAAGFEENEPTVVDTEGERYEGEMVALDQITPTPIINVDELSIETEEVDDSAKEAELAALTRAEVEDSLKTLTDEAAEIELPKEDLTLANEATDALAERISDDLADQVDADDGENKDADQNLVDAAVAEAMEEVTNFNESADATDAVEVTVEEPEEEVVEEVVEEVAEEPVEEPAVETFAVAAEENEESDDDDDNDNDDDDDSFAGIDTAGLKFIDVVAEPEAYNEMLEQERQGRLQIVYRYRRSFTSRMVQSQGSVQDYYSAIKNLLLSYKGIKGRVSWNYEAFNRGRVHVAKVNAKTKTLYLYLALNPEELADTKYTFVDMSAKKKYASVPVLMKIKGERKFKHALELIEKLCGETLELKQLENLEEVDYRMDYKTTEELVAEGVVKKLAAGVPIVEETEAEAAVDVEKTPVEEIAEEIVEEAVPAVEEATEEVAEEAAPAVEEAAEEVVEEAVVADVTDEEPKTEE